MIRLLTILVLPYLLFSAPPIVLVHLGKYLPPYYKTAITQAKLFNPESEIYLLVESHPCRLIQKGKIDLPDYVQVINIDRIPGKEKEQAFHKMTTHFPPYWKYVFDRFFVLERVAKEIGLNDFLHIEGDVLLYVNFDEMIPEMHSHTKGILMGYLNEIKAGPGIMFIKDHASIAELNQYILDNYRVDPIEPYRWTDMSLSAVSGLVGSLPVIPPGYSDSFDLISPDGNHASDTPSIFEGYIRYFDERCLFDPNPYGLYFDGHSPAAKIAGVPGFIDPVAVYRCQNLPLIWKRDSKGRAVPYIRFEDVDYRLANIHLHSKKLQQYLDRIQKEAS